MESYCPSITQYQRWNTRTVMVGEVGVGGQNPIRLQSMTTTDTMDTKGTIEQSIRMIKVGCEIVRITAPSIKEAKNLSLIKKGLIQRGYSTPLVADIHFTPNAAELAATIVEKVRVNPGNYADRKKFESYDYSDRSYGEELERIRDKFLPLVKICKENGTSMRIGTNHGSLSDRIMSRYGDTPLGMVESAMEFIRIAEEENYHDIILSMKASNTQVMVQGYRLLVKTMIEERMNYPLHLGVTEAGDSDDGRIKSALGIGTLLEDGLGDTIRVSLTEEPEAEIPVAMSLAARYKQRGLISNETTDEEDLPYDPFFHKKRETKKIFNLGGKEVPRVVGDLSNLTAILPTDLGEFGYLYAQEQDKWHISDLASDYIYIGGNSLNFEIPATLSIIQDYGDLEKKDFHFPLYTFNQNNKIIKEEISFIKCSESDDIFSIIKSLPNCIIILESNQKNAYAEQRKFFIDCIKSNIKTPVIVKRSYPEYTNDELLLYASTDIGGLQIDGFGDGIWICSDNNQIAINEISFGILQASRSRISKTEYISCPSCGRTLFDLQETTAKIRARTDHLKGIKIGIMGCIVNGPGEMADADYGYVGTGTGQISLYKGQDVVQKNISESLAVDALIKLIDSHGDWVQPSDV